MLPGHYAPRTRSVRVDAPEELAGIPWPDRAAVLVFELLPLPALPQNLDRVDLADPKTAGERLYAVLHQLDAAGLDLIVVVLPPDRPQWRAIRDRLIRATRPCRP
jgi:L-threonylcarbamoyladenylate synthase